MPSGESNYAGLISLQYAPHAGMKEQLTFMPLANAKPMKIGSIYFLTILYSICHYEVAQ